MTINTRFKGVVFKKTGEIALSEVAWMNGYRVK